MPLCHCALHLYGTLQGEEECKDLAKNKNPSKGGWVGRQVGRYNRFTAHTSAILSLPPTSTSRGHWDPPTSCATRLRSLSLSSARCPSGFPDTNPKISSLTRKMKIKLQNFAKQAWELKNLSWKDCKSETV